MKMYNRLIIIMLFIFIVFSISIMTVYGYGGGSTSEDAYGNIFKYEIKDQNLVYNQSIKYQFSTPELGIYEILVNGKNSESDISVKVEDLINTSEYANKSSPGIVYRNENVWIGTSRINYVTVRFRVNNSWINSHSLDDSHYPHLLKWNGDTWLVLQTNILSKDGTYTYFEAPKAGSTSASVFAISAQDQLSYDTVSSDDPTPTTTTDTVDTKLVPIDTSMTKHNDYTGLDIGIVVIVVVLVFYVLRIKKN